MSDRHEDEENAGLATREYLDLKLAGFRSEMRLLFVVAVAGNALLSHIALSPIAGYIGSGITLAGAVGVKLLLLR